MLKISIPTPCHEDWNTMIPAETGRHCRSCAKTVVDFTSMSDEEVKNYFLNNKEGNTCGRFRQSQLNRAVIELPQNIFSIKMPLWKKFLAACLIAFGTSLFSCETITPEIKPDGIEAKNIKTDHPEDQLYVGGLTIIYDSIPVPDNTCSVTVGNAIQLTAEDFTEKGLLEIIEPITAKDSGAAKVDTFIAGRQPVERIIVGDSIYEEIPAKKEKIDSPVIAPKVKNPAKADSIKCNGIKNYY